MWKWELLKLKAWDKNQPFVVRPSGPICAFLLVVFEFGVVEVNEALVRPLLQLICVNLECRVHVLQLRWRFIPHESGLAAWAKQMQFQTLEQGPGFMYSVRLDLNYNFIRIKLTQNNNVSEIYLLHLYGFSVKVSRHSSEYLKWKGKMCETWVKSP